MSKIIPLGYYTLTDIFNKIGNAIYPDNWGDDIINFSEGRYDGINLYTHYNPINPITEKTLFSEVLGYPSKIYTNDEIQILTDSFLQSHNEWKQNKLEERLRLAEKLNEHGATIKKTTRQKTITTSAFTDIQRIKLLTNGIYYANIAVGLKQIFYNSELLVHVFDHTKGVEEAIGNSFWLSETSIYNLKTSIAEYNSYNTSYKRSITYKGTLIIKQEDFDEYLKKNLKHTKNTGKKQSGRKTKINWEAVQIEIFRRIKDCDKDSLPKQDALAQEIVDWCLEQYGETIGLSTIKKRLKSIYEIYN